MEIRSIAKSSRSGRSSLQQHQQQQQGLFATRAYAAGDVICHEDAPLLRLAPTASDEEALIAAISSLPKPAATAAAAAKAGETKQSTTRTMAPTRRLWSSINVPSFVAESYHGTFKGMVQAALCWIVLYNKNNNNKNGDDEAKSLEQQKKNFLELYAPNLEKPETGANGKGEENDDDEASIVQLARQALQYVKEHCNKIQSLKTNDSVENGKDVDDDNDDDDKILMRVILIWACNSFEQGRVYHTISRINHSCNPNAIVQTGNNSTKSSNGNSSVSTIAAANKEEEAQQIVAATSIAMGDEICISYLGLLLYADTAVRRAHLRQTKHFTCACSRCNSDHHNIGDHDDDVSSATTATPPTTTMDLAGAVPCFQCHPRVGRQLDEDTQYDDEQTVQYAIPQIQEHKNNGNSDAKAGATSEAASGTMVVYTCTKCGTQASSSQEPYAKCITTMDKVVQKVVKFLRDYDTRNGKHDEEEEDDDEEEVQDEMLEQHISMSSSVLGAKHWTTNLLLLLQVDRTLQSIHGAMLTANNGAGKKGSSSFSLPENDMDRIAATVDSLERVVRFITGLGLYLHHGHVTGDVIIGLARALVALGDYKSQTYAAEWLEKIDKEYVQLFCTPGIAKVVDSLQTAWKRNHDDEDNYDGSKKPAAKKARL